MKKLKKILEGISIARKTEFLPEQIQDIQYDSRQVKKGDVFVALKGQENDGHLFIRQAVENGASLIVVEQWQDELTKQIGQVLVSDTHSALALMAANFYNHPSQKLTLVGVTGTNGKTTTATLLYQLFRKAGFKAGLLSTIQILINDKKYPVTHTTPDPLMINYYLNEMYKSRVTHVFMEVSSHAIDQKRIEYLDFDGAIFTNLSHDHLDYHKTFINYRDTKKIFFDGLKSQAFALVNIDDKNGLFMIQNTLARKYTYASKKPADYKAKILEQNFAGMLLSVNLNEAWVQLLGDFNVYNILAIYATAKLLGLESIEILKIISELKNVDGRFEVIISPKGKIAIVDYAHTPDALKNVLKTINNIRPKKTEKLITVVGTGGNRDKTKRPEMAAIAASLSDMVIFTSDNPRNENPEAIIDDMEAGVPIHHYKKTLRVTDRKQAIKTAGKLAQPGDIILIAGKGHENYQIIKGKKTHLDDREEIKKEFGLIK